MCRRRNFVATRFRRRQRFFLLLLIVSCFRIPTESCVRLVPRITREYRRSTTDWRGLLQRTKSEPIYKVTMGTPSVYVISLRRTSSRKLPTLQSLRTENVEFEISEAVDGLDPFDVQVMRRFAGKKKSSYLLPTQNWSKSYLLQLKHAHDVNKLRDAFLKKSLHERLRFGCYMSHVSVWQTLIDKSLPYAVILEDDVILVEGFLAKFSGLLEVLPASWGLLYLNGSFRRLGAQLAPGIVQSRGGVGLFGYVISSRAVEHFLMNAALRSDKAIDHMVDEEVLSGRVLAFHAEPPLLHLIPDLASTLAYV